MRETAGSESARQANTSQCNRIPAEVEGPTARVAERRVEKLQTPHAIETRGLYCGAHGPLLRRLGEAPTKTQAQQRGAHLLSDPADYRHAPVLRNTRIRRPDAGVASVCARQKRTHFSREPPGESSRGRLRH